MNQDWGSIIGSAMVGFAGGAAQSEYDDINRQMNEAIALRNMRVGADLQQQTYAADRATDIANVGPMANAQAQAAASNAQTLGTAKGTQEQAEFDASQGATQAKIDMATQAKVKEEQARPIPRGATVAQYNPDGTVTAAFTAPDDKSVSGYYDAITEKMKADAAKLNAQADALSKGTNISATDLPLWKNQEDENGHKTIVDQHSSLYMKYVPDDPKNPTGSQHLQTFDSETGRPALASDVYPALKARMSSIRSGASPQPTTGIGTNSVSGSIRVDPNLIGNRTGANPSTPGIGISQTGEDKRGQIFADEFKNLSPAAQQAFLRSAGVGVRSAAPPVPLDQWMVMARRSNPGASDDQLKAFYSQKYGN